jgi:hypothetical protein
MTIIANADLRLTLIVYTDEEKDLVTILRDVAKEIKRGKTANNVGSCLGSYQYDVVELDRDAQLRIGADVRYALCVAVVDHDGLDCWTHSINAVGGASASAPCCSFAHR